MGKLKQGNQIGDTRLRCQTIKGKEIAPVYHKAYNVALAYAEADAMIQASNAGYRAVCVQAHDARPHQSSVFVLDESGHWVKASWAFGKWGKLSEKDKGGIYKVAPAPAPLLLPASVTPPAEVAPPASTLPPNVRIESVIAFRDVEIAAVTARLVELLTPPIPRYELDAGGV